LQPTIDFNTLKIVQILKAYSHIFFIFEKKLKTMKKYLTILCVILTVISCGPQMDCETESNGFTRLGQTISMGNQSSVDVVVEMDKAWMSADFDKLASFISDSAKITMSDGQKASNAEEFISIVKKEYDQVMEIDSTKWSWVMDYAFSVKVSKMDSVNAPNTRGEYVNAGFTSIDSTSYNEWYQIENGKVIYMSSYKRENK
tara:strand:- start:2529 stop:3131 length:603 start_codon:yes stop_codon:yes gene_type:complete